MVSACFLSARQLMPIYRQHLHVLEFTLMRSRMPFAVSLISRYTADYTLIYNYQNFELSLITIYLL